MTPFPRSRVVALHRQGMTNKQIAEELDVSRSGLYYHLRKMGLTPNTTVVEPLSTRQAKAVLSAYDRGATIADIARRLGITYDQARYVIRTRT